MTAKIDWTKPIQQRNGLALEFVKRDDRLDSPNICLRKLDHGRWIVDLYSDDGQNQPHYNRDATSNAINVPKKHQLDLWLNVYCTGTKYFVQSYDTEAEAKASTPWKVHEIARIHLVREFTEGEGL